MIDTLRSEWPADMTRAADRPEWTGLESMANDTVDWVKVYAREHPTSFALWAFGIGFILGWKLKPW